MVQSKQRDEWAHTCALIAGVVNLFADKADRIAIETFMPEHMRASGQKPPPALLAGAGGGMQGLRKAFEAQFGV